MLPFVVIFLLAGLFLVKAGRKLEGEARRSANWPSVPGQLEQCEVVELPGIQVDDTSTWQLRIRYSYEVRGRTYHSTRYAFGYGDGRDDKKHRQIAETLNRAPQLYVHYDPKQPSEAVISSEVQTNITSLGYSSLAMAAISALIGFFKGW